MHQSHQRFQRQTGSLALGLSRLSCLLVVNVVMIMCKHVDSISCFNLTVCYIFTSRFYRLTPTIDYCILLFYFILQLFGRTLVCCIAKDNGRTREFIRRKEYPDKTQCFECGEFGHLSYKCTKNVLGERKRPRRKKKKKTEKPEVDDYFNPDISLAEAIAEDAAAAEELEKGPALYQSPEGDVYQVTPDGLHQMPQSGLQQMPPSGLQQMPPGPHQMPPSPQMPPGFHQLPPGFHQIPQEFHQPGLRMPKMEPQTDAILLQGAGQLQVLPSEEKKKKKSNKRYQQDSYFSDEEILEDLTGD